MFNGFVVAVTAHWPRFEADLMNSGIAGDFYCVTRCGLAAYRRLYVQLYVTPKHSPSPLASL